MKIPREIIDNSEDNKLATFLNEVLKSSSNGNLDIASAFFNVQAYAMLKDNLNGVKRFRLLLGKSPEISSNKTLGDELLKLVREEIEGLDLTKEEETTVKTLIEFLKRDNVEIRLYEKEFFHGKAYIFDNLVIIGSSNFTSSGLTHNTELNSVSLEESKAIYTREKWFNKFWEEARDFKVEMIELLENSRYGSKEYSPYEIYIKALFELQKEDIKAEQQKEAKEGRPPTKVNLAEFQSDAVTRIITRLHKYGSVFVADSVGLGKTWIAKKIIEEIGYYERRGILVICPAQLRDMWRKELKKINIPENIMSQEELAGEDFLKKARKAIGSRLDEIELVVVDESHNFRNPLSNRWENFFTLVHDNIAKGGKKPYLVFLTATPINNTIWDLYWQIMLLVSMDRNAFIKENIPDLFKYFKEASSKGDPSILNDLLNEISIRRTRDYIKENYPDAYIEKETGTGEVKREKIVFPERALKNINYELDKTYQGMYKWISDIITEKLTMAYYKILQYKKTEQLSLDEQLVLGRMIALDGIFRTLLLKRLESSIEAFRISISNHIKFLRELQKYLNQGKFLKKEQFIRYILKMEEELDEAEVPLSKFDITQYKKEKLLADIEKDQKLLQEILDKIEPIRAKDDAKLNQLKSRLLPLTKEGRIIIFTYFSDTLKYIYGQVSKSKEFGKLRIEMIYGGTSPKERERLLNDFLEEKIDVLMSTDILSEGMNLQSAKIVINYDLHWNPTRMIQRAGRIDRIGSPYKTIYVYNFFPEDELEELLRLVAILQNKIKAIDESVGLDQSILGEEIHPKVFGIIRRIRQEDKKVLDELERDVFGGGERFYQPLKDYLKSRAVEELEQIPHGVFSGLRRGQISGVFFYYKYGGDFHFWYLYDVANQKVISNKTEIINFIECKAKEKRVIPDLFENVFDLNSKIKDEILDSYKEIEQKQTTDSGLSELNRDRSTKFVGNMIMEVEQELEEYLDEYPEDKEIESVWDAVKSRLVSVPFTKKRLRLLRRIWKDYKKSKNWRKLIKLLEEFLKEKGIHKKEAVKPFDSSLLKLVVIDFIT